MRIERDGRMAMVLALSLILAGAAESAGPTGASPSHWVVATYAYPQRDRAAAIQPLAEYLARRGGHPVELRVLASPTALVDAMRDGSVDVAVPNLHGFLRALESTGLDALPVPDVPAADADRYRAVLVARRGVETIEQLQHDAHTLRLVLVGPDSASGGFVPAAYLRTLGLDVAKGFASLAYAGSHDAALRMVQAGEADVAALAADVHANEVDAGVNLLWRSDPIPPGPLLCRLAPGIPCEAMAGWLLDAHLQAPEVMAALRAGWPEYGNAEAFRRPDESVLQMRLPAAFE